MRTAFDFGTGGGKESSLTEKAKHFLLKFLLKAREVIANVDILIKTEHQVHCPPMLLREEEGVKAYQVDVAVIIPGYEKFNLGFEIDGDVGHNHALKDEARDEWIYKNKGLPILRLKLDWIKDWIEKNDYFGLLKELMYRHETFKFAKLPKSPILHLAHKNRNELFGNY